MGSKANTGFTVLLLLASMLEGFIGFASAQPMEVLAGGELEYQHNCAVCHGAADLVVLFAVLTRHWSRR
jgi:mono/diheme cytochrome c family protein